MSGKKAKLLRQQVSLHRLPPANEQDLEKRRPKQFRRAFFVPDAPVNHNRRIIGLSRSQGITIDEAASRYAIKIGVVKAPKLS